MMRTARDAHDLAEANIGLATRWALFYKRRDSFREIDIDDIAQEGCLGLLRASQLYDPRRNCRFSTYASRWIRCFIIRLGKREKANPDKPCDPCKLDSLTIPESGVDASGGAAASETQNAVFASLSALDGRSRDIIMSRFAIGRKKETLREIGVRHGITGGRVQQIERNALKKLQKSKALTSFNIHG